MASTSKRLHRRAHGSSDNPIVQPPPSAGQFRWCLAASTSRHTLWQKANSLSQPLIFWLITTTFAIVYCLAVYHVLLQGNPQIGIIVLSAMDTNYIVAILSQAFSMLTEMTLKAVLDSLRWELAASNLGVSFSTFVQLSGATDFLAILKFAIASRCENWWGALRLLLPVAGLFLGTILKYQANFEFYFTPQSQEFPVYAGLMPIDTRVLAVVPTSIVCLYFTGWIPSLLSTPKYSVSMPMDDCNGNCSSMFLPGGLEIARKVRPIVNSTILEGGIFNSVEAVRISNAPGLALKYDRLGAEFMFDPTSDCSYYGEIINETIQICAADVNKSIAVGWVACPTALHDGNLCNSVVDWKTTAMRQKVLLTVYRQTGTTSYDRQDLGIQNVEKTSDPILQPVNRTQFQPIWDKIFRPTGGPMETETDRTQIRSLLFSLAFLLRLYDDVFPDDPFTPLTHLQNFLAIPLQFNTVCVQYANYTVRVGNTFAMSADMLTTAAGGRASDHLVSQPWTVYAFIGGSVGALLLVAAILVAMLCRPKLIPNSTGVPEMDILAVAQRSRGHEIHDGEAVSLYEMSQNQPVVVESAWRMAAALRRRRLKLVSESESERYRGDQRKVLVTMLGRGLTGPDNQYSGVLT